MNGIELFRLGRKLMKIGEESIPEAAFHKFPPSVLSVMIDILEHPDSSIGEITARTGFPQSHVSASVTKLRRVFAVVTSADPEDGRRTLVRPSSEFFTSKVRDFANSVETAIGKALGTADVSLIREIIGGLEALAQRLSEEPRTPEH